MNPTLTQRHLSHENHFHRLQYCRRGDFIDRVNKGVSDGPGTFLTLVAVALIAIGL
jgi:hypothetical protein